MCTVIASASHWFAECELTANKVREIRTGFTFGESVERVRAIVCNADVQVVSGRAWTHAAR